MRKRVERGERIGFRWFLRDGFRAGGIRSGSRVVMGGVSGLVGS